MWKPIRHFVPSSQADPCLVSTNVDFGLDGFQKRWGRMNLLDAEDVDDEDERVAALDEVARAGVAISEVTRDDDNNA